jgi:hypothetical protein
MVSLSYTVLFSLASLVVASHRGEGSMRRRHVHAARCNASGSHVNASASGLPILQSGQQADVNHHASGLPTQSSGPTGGSGLPTGAGHSTWTSGQPTQTSGQPAPTSEKYQLVDHYQGQDFLNEA